jgi:pimeloyl-ACP methyl ester carboxylesterase
MRDLADDLAAVTCGPPVGKLPRLGFLAPLFRTMLGHRGAVAALRRYLVSRQSLERNPRLFAEWDRQIALQPIRWKGLLGQLCAAATHSTGFGLGQLRCPVEVVTGDGDRIISPAGSRILARRIPGATLTILPGLGHAFPLEDPKALPLAVMRVHERSLQEAGPVAAAPLAGQ